jgi:hypothetical protein
MVKLFTEDGVWDAGSSIFVWYDFTDGGSYLLAPSITYTPDYRWFFQVSGTAYMGDPHSVSKFAPYI